MRRLLYCLTGSILLHGVLLWVPFPMSAGGAADAPPRPLRVRLVAEALPAALGPGENARGPVRASQAKTPAGRPQQADASRIRARPVLQKPAKPRRADPEPAATEEPAETVDAAATPAPARKTRGEMDSDAAAATSTRLARGVTREASAVREAAATAGFTPARYARTVKPRYPRKARRAGWEGTTVLKVLVNPDGAPGRVTVDRTSGFGILDSAAVKAVEDWRFHPARRGADTESSWVRVPVTFRLKEDSR
jgi:protein TonB